MITSTFHQTTVKDFSCSRKPLNDPFLVCFEKLKSGYRHYSGFYKDHFNVRDVEECKEECARTPDCRSFSYR